MVAPSANRRPAPAAAESLAGLVPFVLLLEGKIPWTPLLLAAAELLRARFLLLGDPFCFMYSSCALIKAGMLSVAAFDAARLDRRVVSLLVEVLVVVVVVAVDFVVVLAFLPLLFVAAAENSTWIRS